MRRAVTISLALAVLTAPLSAASAQFGSSSYNADLVFPNGSPNQHPMGMAWDGSSYWSVDGGGAGGIRLTQYNGTGTVLNTYAPGLDFRSVFTDALGTVYGRQFNDSRIYKMTSPGVFSPFVSLTGSSLDAQSDVVLNGAGTGYISMNQSGGVVDSWDLTGAHLSSTTLIGYGVGGEHNYPQSRGVVSLGSDYLTYDAGTLSEWDAAGNRVGTTTLNGAGTSFDSYFSLSRADDGRVWVADNVQGSWRGYQVSPTTTTPEPASMTLLATGLVGVLAVARRRRNKAVSA